MANLTSSKHRNTQKSLYNYFWSLTVYSSAIIYVFLVRMTYHRGLKHADLDKRIQSVFFSQVSMIQGRELTEIILFQQPLQGDNSKFLCCLCCKTGPISAIFRIDRTGYVPGDTILLNAEISNNSNRTMNNSKVRLVMVSLLHNRPSMGTRARLQF